MPDEIATDRFDKAIPQFLFELPGHAHVPGTGTEPDWPPLEAVKELAPPATVSERWRDNPAYIYGFALMGDGFYWEAHEVWEPVWMNCAPNSAERSLLRALIQMTNAQLKAAMGRQRASGRLIEEAMRDLDDVGTTDCLMGVDLSAMRRALQALKPAPQN